MQKLHCDELRRKYHDFDVITKNVKVKNFGEQKINIKRIMSSTVYLFGDGFDFVHLEGNWGKERNIQRRKIINGEMSRIFHRFIRTRICRGKHRDAIRPILLNNWEETYCNFDEKRIIEMAQRAKEAGVELFVLDDGWFGDTSNNVVKKAVNTPIQQKLTVLNGKSMHLQETTMHLPLIIS